MGYNIYKIAKPKGGVRVISEPDEETSRLSELMLTEIQNELDKMEWSNTKWAEMTWAYTKDKSPQTLVNKIYDFLGECNEYDIFYIDIKDYFGSITKYQVDNLYKNIICMRDQDAPLRSPNQFKSNIIWDLIHPKELGKKGISQGNPLSPMIANLVGSVFIDYSLNTKITSNMMYARYSDDIYVIVKRNTPEYSRDKLYTLIENILKAIKAEPSKRFDYTMSVKGSHQKNIILGIRLGASKGQLKDKNWLRSLYHRIDTKGTKILKDEDIIERFGRNLTYDKFLEKVKGLTAYVLSIDPSMEEYIMEHVSELVIPKEIKESGNAEGWLSLQCEE